MVLFFKSIWNCREMLYETMAVIRTMGLVCWCIILGSSLPCGFHSDGCATILFSQKYIFSLRLWVERCQLTSYDHVAKPLQRESSEEAGRQSNRVDDLFIFLSLLWLAAVLFPVEWRLTSGEFLLMYISHWQEFIWSWHMPFLRGNHLSTVCVVCVSGLTSKVPHRV